MNRQIGSPIASEIDAAYGLYQRGTYSEAISQLEIVPKRHRSEFEYRLLYGACLARSRRSKEAIAIYSQLLEEHPDCHEALTWMAVLTRDPQDMKSALGYAERAVQLKPDDPTGHGALGTSYLTAKQPEDAIASFNRAIELAPRVAEHHHNLALAHLMLNRHFEAIAQLKKAIELAPANHQSYLTLASTYSLFGMAGDALEWLNKGLKHIPNNPQIHSAIANSYAMLRNDELAERHHKRAIDLAPESKSSYGTWLINQGRFKESNKIFSQMVESGTDPAFAYYSLMQSRKLTNDPADRDFLISMTALQKSKNLHPRSEMYLRYALGKANEQLKEFKLAMEHYDAANSLAKTINRTGPPVLPSRFTEEHHQARCLYESMKSSTFKGDPTEVPIFIIGMIRSGTTLLDQIVSSHPAVRSGGELRFWIEESRRLTFLKSPPSGNELRNLAKEYVKYARLLAGSGPRITDKMPLNYACAGVINLIMPNARFIHIRRNPIDTCLSIWTTYFGQGAIFAYDKDNIVAYYREYYQMMDYWADHLPKDRLLTIDYEDLIGQPTELIPQVIDFLGLKWDDSCLHHDQNDSAINTPSRWQARQPIYKTSLERWRQYEPWLGAFEQLR